MGSGAAGGAAVRHPLTAFNSDAVLDKETGLVWEKSPATTAGTSSSARSTCANKAVGGRKGWRLPSMPELATGRGLSGPDSPAGPSISECPVVQLLVGIGAYGESYPHVGGGLR